MNVNTFFDIMVGIQGGVMSQVGYDRGGYYSEFAIDSGPHRVYSKDAENQEVMIARAQKIAKIQKIACKTIAILTVLFAVILTGSAVAHGMDPSLGISHLTSKKAVAISFAVATTLGLGAFFSMQGYKEIEEAIEKNKEEASAREVEEFEEAKRAYEARHIIIEDGNDEPVQGDRSEPTHQSHWTVFKARVQTAVASWFQPKPYHKEMTRQSGELVNDDPPLNDMDDDPNAIQLSDLDDADSSDVNSDL